MNASRSDHDTACLGGETKRGSLLIPSIGPVLRKGSGGDGALWSRGSPFLVPYYVEMPAMWTNMLGLLDTATAGRPGFVGVGGCGTAPAPRTPYELR